MVYIGYTPPYRTIYYSECVQINLLPEKCFPKFCPEVYIADIGLPRNA